MVIINKITGLAQLDPTKYKIVSMFTGHIKEILLLLH